MKMSKMQRYFLITFGCSFVGFIICKHSFLPICKIIAKFFDCDYAVIALSLYLIIFVIIGCILKSVRTSVYTETYYKNNFTPTKAIILVLMLIFFHVNLIDNTIQLDEEGKIISLYKKIFTEKSENNHGKELKNDTDIKTEKNNDFSSDTDDDGMRYRD